MTFHVYLYLSGIIRGVTKVPSEKYLDSSEYAKYLIYNKISLNAFMSVTKRNVEPLYMCISDNFLTF